MTTLAIEIDPISTKLAEDGLYLRFIHGAEHFVAISLDGMPPDGPVAAVMLIDQFMQDRVDALARFRDVLLGRRVSPDRRITPQRRHHLIEMLRAVDARRAGATYQETAEAVFDAERVRAVTWKSMPLRDTVMRRTRVGQAFVAGGYRALLHSHRIQ